MTKHQIPLYLTLEVQILHIFISFGSRYTLIFISINQFHVIVDSVCIDNVSRNTITFVFYLKPCDVHSRAHNNMSNNFIHLENAWICSCNFPAFPQYKTRHSPCKALIEMPRHVITHCTLGTKKNTESTSSTHEPLFRHVT